jgi:TonB family protein
MANAQHTRTAHGTSDEVNLEFDAHRSGADEAHHPPILVLSRDPNLVETVKKAAPRGTSVAPAPDLDHVAGKLSDLKPGVLVADTASTADVAAMVAQLTQHFPELVVIVAGKREDSAALMQLTATGRIFRFLLTPLSHGQTRLALEAAVTQHQDLLAQGQRLSAASGTTGGDNKNYVVTYGALAAGLLIVIGGIWFGVNKFTGEPPPPVVQQQTPAGQPGGVPEKIDPVQAELGLAKEAFAAGKYLEPAGDSALDYYRSALALDPNSAAAKEGIRDVVDKILERAEQSLTSEKLEDASRNIELARDIDPAHPRLVFLDTQMARERERIKLSQAADVANKVKALVNSANDRMQAGRLITPSNASARDALVEARRLDATDPNVVQSVREFAALLTEEARKSVAEGDLAEAQSYVTVVRQMGSAGAALAAVERQLADANRAASAATQQRRAQPSTSASDPLVADIRQRITEGKLIDPPGESARDLLVSLRTSAPTRPEVEELSKQLTTRLLESGKGATSAKAFPRAEQLIAAAREVGARYNEAAIAQAERDLASAREANALATNIVSANSLKRTRTVQPVYPEAARKKGIEGWVELAFTVTPNGTVQDVQVRNASPANVFEDAAVRAIRGWRFEPVERDGVKVAQRAMVRLRFAQSPNQ